jgi:hypothetical protein
MLNPQTLTVLSQLEQQVSCVHSIPHIFLYFVNLCSQMAGMGVNPIQGSGAHPIGAFLGQQQPPPQAAALVPTPYSPESQVSAICSM